MKKTKIPLTEFFKANEIGPLPDNYEGHILILDPNIVREECREKNNLVWRVTGGFGCDTASIGRAVFATCLGDGEHARWGRSDFVAAYKGAPIKTITRRERIDAISNVLLDMDKETLREKLLDVYSQIRDGGIKQLCRDFNLSF